MLRRDVVRAIRQLEPTAQLGASSIHEHLDKIEQQLAIPQPEIIELSVRMTDAAARLESLSKEGKVIDFEYSLWKSLDFDKRQMRFDRVDPAYVETFEWIFRETIPHLDRPLNFVQWLSSECGIYWVTGKPGSGKSTLMKFIWSHERTQQELLRWAGDKFLFTGQFFFWYSGSLLQKSQEGLLRSLLYEVLRQCPRLIRKIWPELMKDDYMPPQLQLISWSRQDLLGALQRLIQLDEIPKKFCFFIDGLDEYDSPGEGDLSELVILLQKLAESPNVKLCVSSRPWWEFGDVFGGDPKRYIRLHELTADDIRKYVHSNLSSNKKFQQLAAEDEEYVSLEEEIVTKASGVFLWVYLVVRSLLRGITGADQIQILHKRLSELPENLDQFFQHMLNSIEKIYRDRTAQLIHTAHHAVEPLPLMTYSFLDDIEVTDVYAAHTPLDSSAIAKRRTEMTKRIDARTKGFLEVVNTPDPALGPFFSAHVDFIHRTARDYLATRDVQQTLKPYLPVDFNANLALAKTFLVQFKTLPDSTLDQTQEGPFFRLSLLLLHYICRYELDPKAEQNQSLHILREAETVALTRPRQFMRRKRTAFPGFLVQCGHLPYIEWRLTQDPPLIRSKLHPNRGQPLLDIALNSRLIGPNEKPQNWGTRVDMVRRILGAGANPNDRFKDATVWERYLCKCIAPGKANKKYSPGQQEFLQIAKLLVEYGADLDRKFDWETMERVTPKSSIYQYGWSDGARPQYKTTTWKITKSAREILTEQLSADDAELVLGADRRLLSSLWSWIRRTAPTSAG